MHNDFVLWCNVVLQRRWASGVSVVTTGATWVRESGKSGHLGPSSKESKCYLRWGRDGMEWWWNGRTSSFGNTVLRKSTHSNFWLDFCTRWKFTPATLALFFFVQKCFVYRITWSLAKNVAICSPAVQMCADNRTVYFEPWINAKQGTYWLAARCATEAFSATCAVHIVIV